MKQPLSAIIFFLLGLIIIQPCWAQTNTLAIGEWKAHLPYLNVNHVEQSDEKVYYATQESILIYDKDDGSQDFLSKVEGLAEANIQDLLYDSQNEILVIAYGNSVIDLVTQDEIISITDIRDKTDLQGDKQIYDMYIQDGKFLYLATGFGLVQFDLGSFEFGFTMEISRKILAVAGAGDDLLIALDDGVYTLDVSSTNTPGFFDEWQPLTSGLPTNSNPVDVYMQNQKKYVATSSALYQAEESDDFELLYLNDSEDLVINFINPAMDGWMLGMVHEEGKGEGRLIQFDAQDTEMGWNFL